MNELKTKAPNGAQATCSSCRAWLVAAGIVLIGLGSFFRSMYQFTVVSGDSMFPTLKPGDLLLVKRRAYELAEPDRGDIVVARQPGCLVVKRVVGLPGEEVEVKQGNVYINGECVEEKHQLNEGFLSVGEGKLLPGDFATLGDNRAVSALTAVHPIVTKAEILGKVVLIIHANYYESRS